MGLCCLMLQSFPHVLPRALLFPERSRAIGKGWFLYLQDGQVIIFAKALHILLSDLKEDFRQKKEMSACPLLLVIVLCVLKGLFFHKKKNKKKNYFIICSVYSVL